VDVSGAKVAVVPTFVPQRNQYSAIFATYWRESDEVRQVVDVFINATFVGRQVVGHSGAKSVALLSEQEVQNIPTWARQLDEALSQRIYTPKVTTFIPDSMVARALSQDFGAILQRLTEILETQRRMYQEYLELKRRQVQLLEQTGDSRRRAD